MRARRLLLVGAMRTHVGATFGGGRYRVVSHLGSGGMSSVYLAEHVLMQRVELLNLLGRARDSYASLRQRRELAGKEIPSWSKSDFQSRIKEIERELDSNTGQAHRVLEAFFANLKSPAEKESITYH